MNIEDLKAFTKSTLPAPVVAAMKRGWQAGRRTLNRVWFQIKYPQVTVLDIVGVEQGQLNQPIIVDYLLNSVRDGFFLDIGANHPQFNSNTYYLESARGYSGIAFDPMEKYREEWHATRPRTRFLTLAVGSTVGQVTFYQHANSDGWADQLSFTGLSGRTPTGEVEARVVDVKPISAIEGVPSEIAFASIDVEGAESEVLKGFGANVRPLVLVVENCFGPFGNEALRDQVRGMGYELVARISYIDDVYVRRDFLRGTPDLKSLRDQRRDLFR